MKRTTLERITMTKENRELVKLFEKSLSKKLDELFKKESPNLYNNLNKGLKRAICHLSPDGVPHSKPKFNN
jgi:hypothetical protein